MLAVSLRASGARRRYLFRRATVQHSCRRSLGWTPMPSFGGDTRLMRYASHGRPRSRPRRRGLRASSWGAGDRVPRNDVAIYTPHARALYERRPGVAGGAERQTMLLARG